MADWYFYDANGYKIGPIKSRELKQSAQQGLITPETIVEDEKGLTALAKQITGLTFSNAAQPEVVPLASDNPSTIAVPLPNAQSAGTGVNYFYFDQTNQKLGPVSESQLHLLVAQGAIGPMTPLETDGGYKGLAEQISGLFPDTPHPAPKQLFCTNCGDPVPEHAVGCMSCGIKPTGHKKFCRQCGIAINPEQIVCTKCGAKIGRSIIPDVSRAKQVAHSIFGQVKQWIVPVAVTVTIVVGIYFAGSAVLGLFGGSNRSHIIQLKKAKSGDWAEYELTMSAPESDTERVKFKVEVMSNDGKRVRLQATTDGPSRRGAEKTDIEIDLSKSDEEMMKSMLGMDMSVDMPIDVKNILDKIKFDIKKGRKSRETLSIAGQSFNCFVIPYTIDVTVGNVTITVRDIKEWTSKTAPVGGIVRTEYRTEFPTPNGRTETFSISISLTSFRKT